MRLMIRFILGGLTLAGLAVMAPWLYTALRYQSKIVSVNAAPRVSVAIVFGAGLRWDGGPTAVLHDRIATAAELFHTGKVEWLLMSGDNRVENYDEPGAMRRAAIALGVPEAAIVLDEAGQRTYDTCYRAKAIFGLDEVILVTQAFHLPRALFICEALGLKAYGVSADRRPYLPRSLAVWNTREVLATAAAWWDVTIAKPTPILGEPLPIQ
jgi:SanA protein